ncbi:MAG: hypothetical protein M1838_003810 [Thelocarpon superellum]|nr:MAG: hypothetical protein M1838_003810 [Thelocarpon superellum]
MSRHSSSHGRTSTSHPSRPPPSTAAGSAAPTGNVRYTVLVRLPFPRHDFVDPPQVDWDAGKERKLWQILSQVSGGNLINWQELADQFDVSLPFLLQQAAWLYERQLSQVRAQMRRVGNLNASSSPSPVPGSSSGSATGAQSMRRGPSGGAGKYPSAEADVLIYPAHRLRSKLLVESSQEQFGGGKGGGTSTRLPETDP